MVLLLMICLFCSDIIRGRLDTESQHEVWLSEIE